MKYLYYDTEVYPFKDILKDNCKVKIDSFHYIHNHDMVEAIKIERSNDQSYTVYKPLYEAIRSSEFKQVYEAFILDFLIPELGNKLVYQTIPNIRIHRPASIAVGEFHRDRDYKDVAWASQVKELNIYLPLTYAYDSATIQVESKEGLADYSPINSAYGEAIIWDGANLKHGNRINLTECSRVSLDFRVIRHENFVPLKKGSINQNILFDIGEYYSVIGS